VIAGGVLSLVLALARVLLALHLGTIGDEVIGVIVAEAALLLSTTAMVLAVVVDLLELVDVDGGNDTKLHSQNTINSLGFKGRIACHEHILSNNKFHLCLDVFLCRDDKWGQMD